jgi:polar amino acid transport system substrate-binding protein
MECRLIRNVSRYVVKIFSEVDCTLEKLRRLAVLMSFLALFAGITVSEAAESGVLRVGTEGTYPPFEYYDESNSLTGFDVELVKAIGVRIGREVELIDMAFDGLIPALLSGKIDMIAAAVNATEERKKRVDFSDVYHLTDAAIITKSDNTDIRNFDDLRGKVVGVQLGTVQDIYLTGLGIPDVKRYQKTDDAVREVLLDRNDGVFLDTVTGNSYVNNDRFAGYLKIAFKETISGPEEGFSLGLRKGGKDLLDAVNAALRELENSGELQALREKYQID